MEQHEAEKIAQDLFAQWNELLQTGDKSKVAAMYSDDASFLPTLNGELKRGIKGAEEYFTHFLAKNPIGTVVESVTQISSDESLIAYSGLYDFELDGESGREIVHARFTFIFQKNSDGVYKIVHHHSSLRP